MTVAANRTIDNSIDVGRKVPTTSLADRVLTSLEGHVVESLAGPDAVGAAPANKIVLSRPATEIAFIMSYVTATGAAGAILFPIDGTHWNFVGEDPQEGGNASLTNPSITDFSAETWVVAYRPLQAEGTIGGQSSVSG